MDKLSPQSLLQLAQYQPFRDGGATREATFRKMIAPVLMEAGGELGSLTELREAFQTLFGVEVDPEEIDDWLEHLEEMGAINRNGSVIAVTPAARALLEEHRHSYEELSAKAKQEWRVALIGIEPALSEEDLDNLADDLDQLIALIVAYHGAEAAVILYPEEERSSALRETLRAKTETLPKRGPELDEVRRQGFAQFFYAPTESQRRYLADRLDHGFFATVGTLRPEGAEAVRDELAGQRLYLDTNILIGAFGLAGRHVNESTRRLLELSKGLGLELAVTSQTVEEFRHSLARAKDQIVSRGLPSRRYAAVLRDAAREVGGVSLIEGYYESYGEHGSQPDDWFRRAAQTDPMFRELEISVVDEGLPAVLKNETQRINDYVVLLGREAAFRSRRPRDDLPMQHDAIHRVLIERLRGAGHRRFANAKYWFLTEDKILPRFGQLALEGEPIPEVPFCISGAAWRQIARCFTPRTDDFEQTITDLLASPYLRFGQARNLGEVQQVIGRISVLLGDEGSPAVVAAVVSDETLEAATGAKDQDEQDSILLAAYRETEDKLNQRFQALQNRVEAMEVKLNDERNKREVSTAEVETAQAGQQALKQEIADKERELRESEDALRRERSISASEIDRLKREKTEQEVEQAKRRESRRRATSPLGALGIFLLALGLLVAEVISVPVALLGGGTVIALLIAPFVESSRWAWRVGFVLAVLAVVLALLPLLK